MTLRKFMIWVAGLYGATFLMAGFQAAVAQVDDWPPVPLKLTSNYLAFSDKYDYTQKVDAFYFFKNFPDYKGKVIMTDARFQKKISDHIYFARIWRNFGIMTLVVTDIPDDVKIPEDQPVLLVGLMTGYKNEVVNGKLISMPIIKYTDMYVCQDSRCNQ